jgi:hypothetical protein
MSKLKTIKGKAKLAEYTDYVAIKSNETRRNGSFRMVERYPEFHASLVKIVDNEGAVGREVAELLPNNLEHIKKNVSCFNAFSVRFSSIAKTGWCNQS